MNFYTDTLQHLIYRYLENPEIDSDDIKKKRQNLHTHIYIKNSNKLFKYYR